MLSRLKDPVLRRRIARDMTEGTDDWPNFFTIDWDDIQITTAATEANKLWVGKKVGDVARSRSFSCWSIGMSGPVTRIALRSGCCVCNR